MNLYLQALNKTVIQERCRHLPNSAFEIKILIVGWGVVVVVPFF